MAREEEPQMKSRTKYDPVTFPFTCACGAVFDVTAWPAVEARTSGEPGACSPAEGGEVEPGECRVCGASVARQLLKSAARFGIMDGNCERD